MASTVLYHGGSFQRVVRSKRGFHGVCIGAIKDKGYLVLVRFNGPTGTWTIMKPIRKLG